MKKLIWMLFICFLAIESSTARAEEAGVAYIYAPGGEIKGYETSDYFFNMRDEIIGYKVRDERFEYIYSRDGNMIEYRPIIARTDYQFLYDAEGNIIGYSTYHQKSHQYPRKYLPLLGDDYLRKRIFTEFYKDFYK